MSREVAHAVARSRFAFIFGVGLALLPGVLAAFAGLSWLQHQYFPVIDRFEITETVLDEQGDVTISGQFHKLYPDWMCKYQGMQWFMLGKDPDGRDVRLRVDSSYADVRKNKAQNNRQLGHNPFYGWKINISEYPDSKIFTGFARHRCFGLIPARTSFPELEAPPRTVEFKSTSPTH